MAIAFELWLHIKLLRLTEDNSPQINTREKTNKELSILSGPERRGVPLIWTHLGEETQKHTVNNVHNMHADSNRQG